MQPYIQCKFLDSFTEKEGSSKPKMATFKSVTESKYDLFNLSLVLCIDESIDPMECAW